jgi:hypothetical protein
MYAVIRRYTGASALIAELERKRQDVEEMISGVEGFKAYYAVRSGDSLTTITVCESQAGAEESTRRSAAWVKENLPAVSMGPPQVVGGDVIVHFGR